MPAIAEWHDRIDAQPLTVVHESEVDIQRFAKVFRAFVEGEFGAVIEQCRVTGEPREGRLDGRVGWLVQGRESVPVLTEAEQLRGQCERLIMAAGDLRLPQGTVFLRDVYAGGSVEAEEGVILRAALAEESMVLAPGSRSLRWLHAGSWVEAGTGTVLHGRVSAAERIRLEEGCRFERLTAPRIEFGDAAVEGVHREELSGTTTLLTPGDIPRILDAAAGRWLVRGDLEVPGKARVEANLVVTGTCSVGVGAHVLGSIKSHGDLVLSGGVRVDGSVVSGHRLVIGSECMVMGPVLSEMTIRLETACRIGTPERPTTVSAQRINAECGALAHGTVWARVTGQVQHADTSSRPGAAA